MKKLGVWANCRKPEAGRVLKRLTEKAAALGMELITCGETAALLPGARLVSTASLAAEIDVLLTLGGDGTVLRAVRVLDGSDKPVLGVNLGSLGFLTSVPLEELESALDALHEENFTMSIRSMVECSAHRRDKRLGIYHALNDVVLGWGDSPRISTLELSVDGEMLSSYACDGLIVSTPTGSTGHSLAAGGPILHPGSPCFVISAICPHTLSNRPLVISDQSTISISVIRTHKKMLLSVDGQEELEIEMGDRLELRRSAQGVRFIHLPGYSYYSVLSQKLNWRGSNV